MFDWSFGTGLDGGSFGWGTVTPLSLVTPATGNATNQPTVSGGGGAGGIINSLGSLGLKFYQTYLNNDLANEQVKAGQYPSQNATFGNLGTAVGGSNWLIWVIIIAVALFLFRR